jgi:PrgI family protein
MSGQRHEIPTHLNVADKAFGGLTMRQLLTAAIGLALAYGAASDMPLPLPLRLVIAAVVLLLTVVLALWRPAGRPVEDWAFVLLRFWSARRVAVWRPIERASAHHQRREVLLPGLPTEGECSQRTELNGERHDETT